MKKFKWVKTGIYKDIVFEKNEHIAKITINRPEVRNAFRPPTIKEIAECLSKAISDKNIGAIIITGKSSEAFCSGGDQKIRGDAGYKDKDDTESLGVLGLQRQTRTCPKPVIAMVAGYAIGGGNILALVYDLIIAADNAIFGQTGPKVDSFDGGYGSGYLSRIVGQKKARGDLVFYAGSIVLSKLWK